MALQHLKKLTAMGMALLTASTMCSSISSYKQSGSDYVISASAANDIAKGSYQNITWRIDSNGTLIISADGTKVTTNGITTTEFNIPDFNGSGSAPWYKYRSRIKTLYLQTNLNSIGNYAFYGLTNLQNVYTCPGVGGANPGSCRNFYFPMTLKRIGKYAFADCTSLESTGNKVLNFGFENSAFMKLKSALKIERGAFQNCRSIQGINIYGKCHVDIHGKKDPGYPYDFPIEEYDNYAITIDEFAFKMKDSFTGANASKLAFIDFHDSLVQIGKCAFQNNLNLRDVKIKLSSKPIHKDAFLNTPYNNEYQLYENTLDQRLNVYSGCISSSDEGDPYGESVRNRGSATTLTGKIRIVNIFVDQKIDGQEVSPWNTQKATSAISGTNSNNLINLNAYGSTERVTSNDIAARLDSVRSAMEELQEQAKPYGANFSWDMDTETNFYITLDSDDQLPFEPVTNCNIKKFIGLDSKLLYTDIKAKTDGQIDLIEPAITPKNTKEYSYYTDALHQKGYDSVVYLAHLNLNNPSGYTTRMKRGLNFKDGEELAVINGTDYKNIMHETCHLFGAHDYYRNGILEVIPQSRAETLYTELINAFPIMDDVMFSYYGNTSISPLTAYSIGWRDNLDCLAYAKTYRVFFNYSR